MLSANEAWNWLKIVSDTAGKAMIETFLGEVVTNFIEFLIFLALKSNSSLIDLILPSYFTMNSPFSTQNKMKL
jgi:hypothetical protein